MFTMLWAFVGLLPIHFGEVRDSSSFAEWQLTMSNSNAPPLLSWRNVNQC